MKDHRSELEGYLPVNPSLREDLEVILHGLQGQLFSQHGRAVPLVLIPTTPHPARQYSLPSTTCLNTK